MNSTSLRSAGDKKSKSRGSRDAAKAASSGRRKRKQRHAATSPAAGSPPPIGVDPWDAWVKHLKRRKAPAASQSPRRALAPLFWGLAGLPAAEEARARLHSLVATLRKPARDPEAIVGRLEAWRRTLAAGSPDTATALEALAWARSMPHLAPVLEQEAWTSLLEDLQQVAHDAAGIDPVEHPLVQQILHGELPMTLAVLLPELAAFQHARKVAWKVISRGVKEILDGNGLPQGRHWPQLRPLVACWTRSAWLEQRQLDCEPAAVGRSQLRKLGQRGLTPLSRNARLQVEWAVRETLRGSQWDGGMAFGEPTEAGRSELNSLLAAALAVTQDGEDAAASVKLLKTRVVAPKKAELPAPSEYTEWGELAVMRSGWKPNDPLLAVRFGAEVEFDLSVAKTRLFRGAWSATASLDGEVLAPAAEAFSEVCWHQDEDSDYLELELPLANDWVLQRQIVFAREDQFLFLADAVFSPRGESGLLHYEASLPLADPGVVWKPAAQTREGELETPQMSVAVLPLFQPEWRSEGFDGGLTVGESRLLWSAEVRGRAVYCPLWLNLDRRRAGREHTWRRLTVAHHLEICPADAAAGYRVQQGSQQWLFYRSLAGRAVRTLLGQNLLSDFTAARFHRDGTIDELVEIEAESA